jgi:dipeptidyl aminopeptidase/acylaminoacyl peptidase
LRAALVLGVLGFVAWASDAVAEAAVPGANGKLAFVSTRDGSTEVYAMDAFGAAQTRLTINATGDLAPAWSPDGRKIAFTSLRGGNDAVYSMNADGTAQTRLTGTSAGDFHPAWSPDGGKIAFTSLRDGDAEVYVMNADGTGQTNLTQNPADDYSQDWQALPAEPKRRPACAALVADRRRSEHVRPIHRSPRCPSSTRRPWSNRAPSGAGVAQAACCHGDVH